MQPVRILIVDDHEIVRKGLRAMLESELEFKVVGEAANGSEAVFQAQAVKPDVILMDLMMPHSDGWEAINEIKQKNPRSNIMVLTSFVDDEKTIKAIKAGALGYLLKDVSPEVLFEGIRMVQKGEPYLDPIAERKLIRGLRDPNLGSLTPREIEVLKLVAQGMTNKEIALELVISERTVGTHVSAMLSKLRLSNRVHLALYAIRKGWA